MKWIRPILVVTVAVGLTGCEGTINNETARVLTTSLVSITYDGSAQQSTVKTKATLSGNGRFVAFASDYMPLIATNGLSSLATHVYVRDTWEQTTVCASVSMDGTRSFGTISDSPSISDDGRYVAFTSTAVDLSDDATSAPKNIFVRDLIKGETTLVSQEYEEKDGANGNSFNPCISPDGDFVVFVSQASDLIEGQSHTQQNVFIRNIGKGMHLTRLVSAKDGLTEEGDGPSTIPAGRPVISSDNRYVVFESESTDITPYGNPSANIFVRDLSVFSNKTSFVSHMGENITQAHPCTNPSISGDGRYVVFESTSLIFMMDWTLGSNAISDIYLFDRDVNGNGILEEQDGVGNSLFDEQDDMKLYCVSLTEAQIPILYGTSVASGVNTQATISRDGRYVLFASDQLLLTDINNYLDIYKFDRLTQSTVLISVATGSYPQAKGHSWGPAFSGDGKSFVFTTTAMNLVQQTQTEGVYNVFKRGEN